MKQLIYIGILFVILISGCVRVGAEKNLFKSSDMISKEAVVAEVFILEEGGSIHFWQESEQGIIGGSGRIFSHEHSDSLDNFTDFTITYCHTGQKIDTQLSYADAKLLHNMILENNQKRPLVIRLGF